MFKSSQVLEKPKSNADEDQEPFNCILKEISSNSTEVSPLGTDYRIEKDSRKVAYFIREPKFFDYWNT